MDAIALDAPVRRLFDRVAPVGSLEAPDLEAIGQALVDLAGETAYLEPWIERLGETSSAIPVHAPERGPRLMLVHRLWGQMGAVHDHGVWVAIAPVRGLETHRRYRVRADRSEPRLELVEALEVGVHDRVTLLPPDDLHDHGHLAGRGDPAYLLIMTGDDQGRYERTEWDLATGRSRSLRPGDRGRWLASDPVPPA